MKLILTFFLFFYTTLTYSEIKVSSVNVKCDTRSPTCKDLINSSFLMQKKFNSIEEFRAILKLFLANTRFENLSYQLVEQEGKISLEINLETLHYIRRVQVKDGKRRDPFDFLSMLRTRAGGYFNDMDIESDKELILSRLHAIGFPNAQVRLSLEQGERGKELIFYIARGEPKVIHSVQLTCDSDYILKHMNQRFSDYKKKRFNRDQFNDDLNLLRKDLYSHGYYFLKLQTETKDISQNLINLMIECDQSYLVAVDLDDQNGIYRKENLHSDLKMIIQRSRFSMLNREIERFFIDLYRRHGFLNPKVKVRHRIISDRAGEQVEQYRVLIPKQERTSVKNITFRGNNYFSRDVLMGIFNRSQSDLASRGFYDLQYYREVANRLRLFYIENGYLSAEAQFSIRQAAEPNQFSIYWEIFEGRRSLVREFKVSGLEQNKELDQLAQTHFQSVKIDEHFNPIEFEKEKVSFLEKVMSLGYLNAFYTHRDDTEVVSYSAANQEVSIGLNLNLGNRQVLRDAVVLGVVKTKPETIERKIRVKQGDIITPEYLEMVRVDLASMGIFSNYDVSLLPDTLSEGESGDQHNKLVVRVRERDYGAVEVAPGFRSDLGLKLSSKFSLSNLNGKNQTLSLNAQVNRRLHFQEFDRDRRDLGVHFFEYDFRANYSYPDFYKSYWDYNATVAVSRRRFFSFDADIQRISNTFSRDLTRKINFSLRHQYETIDQYNATRETDNGNFEIGALTPGITFDYRDNPAFTTKGAYINLSCEVARPEFLSQNEPQAKIDFYKLVARNKFYIPFGDSVVLAMALTTGVQKNMAQDVRTDANGNPVTDADGTVLTQGSIPAIKVFRLTGVDLVRGYAEEEINRIEDGRDVSQALVQDKAYMTNIKIEPRYLLSDQFSLGLFYDAGAVQIDQYNPMSLRDSVGVTFKVLTPVGTLDFDYGHKLNRRTFADGRQESPGRVHVSIGFL